MNAVTMFRFRPSDMGCWFDSARGTYIGNAVIDLAITHGFDPKASEPTDGWREHEDYVDIWVDAEDYLNQMAPNGYWIGGNENGDFGMWEVENED